MSKLIEIDAESYHAARGLHMTSHRMIAARSSVADFIADARSGKSDTSSLYFGRASHVYTLEGAERFHQEYVVGGPVNPKTGKCYGANTKKHREWAATQPLPSITTEEFALIERMDRSVKGKKAARQLLEDGKPELTGRLEIEGVPCQVRLDWLTNNPPRIVDYKTCSDISTIAIDCERYSYPIQQAFYRQCVERLIGIRCPVYLIWCEKSEDATSVVWRLDDDRLDEEAAKNTETIRKVKSVFFQLVKEKQRCQQVPSSTTSKPMPNHHPLQPEPETASAI